MNHKISLVIVAAILVSSPFAFADDTRHCLSKWPKDICAKVWEAIDQGDLNRLAKIKGLPALYVEMFMLPGHLTEAQWKEFLAIRGDIKELSDEERRRILFGDDPVPNRIPDPPMTSSEDAEWQKAYALRQFECSYGVDVEVNCGR